MLRIWLAFLAMACTFLAGPTALAQNAPSAGQNSSISYTPDVTFTLRTAIADGKLVFIGETGQIAEQVNPDLKVPVNAVVQINLVNGDGAIHDIAVPKFNAKSDNITGKGAATAIVFRATEEGT